MQTVDKTSTDLRRIKNHKLLETVEGTNSSMLLAKGFINKAYLHSIKENSTIYTHIYIIYIKNMIIASWIIM